MERSSTEQDDASVALLPYDERLLHSRKRYLARPGGYGSGKTTFNAIWHHDRSIINQGCSSWWLAPDYSTARVGFNIYQEYLNQIGWREGVHYKTRRAPDLEIEYTRIEHLVKFKTSNQLLQADTISHLSVDEAGENADDKIARANARVRAPKAKVLQTLYSGAPQGLNHYYKRVIVPGMTLEGNVDQFRYNDRIDVLHYRTYWNRFLPDDFYQTLFEEYGHDQRFVKSWILGIFTPLSQSQCFDFDARRAEDGGHVVDVPYDTSNRQLVVGFDFNLGMMAYVGYQIHDGRWIAKLECPPQTKDTQHACEQLINQVPLHVAKQTNVIIDGDANGYQGAKHGLSCEYDVIQNVLGTHFNSVSVHTPNHNDPVAVRVISTNRLFRQKRLLFNKHLRQSIDSFANTTWENAKIKKTSGEMVTHFSDAGSYPPSRAETINTLRVRGYG